MHEYHIGKPIALFKRFILDTTPRLYFVLVPAFKYNLSVVSSVENLSLKFTLYCKGEKGKKYS